MKYEVRVGGRVFAVEVNGGRVRVGDREFPAVLEPVPHGPLRRLVAPGVSLTLACVQRPGGWLLARGGRTWVAELTDERAVALQRLVGRRATPAADGVVRAPMPGLVLRLEVAEGQQVAAGTGLVVLEAMKMENEIRSPVAGVVRRVVVAEGAAVEKGAPLVELSGQG